MSTCRSCGKEITWVKTEKGNVLPCDMEARVVHQDGQMQIILAPHWATCPDADAWHQKKKAEG